MPADKTNHIDNDKSLVERDFHVFKTWGKNARVVKKPAKNPTKLVNNSIFQHVIDL